MNFRPASQIWVECIKSFAKQNKQKKGFPFYTENPFFDNNIKSVDKEVGGGVQLKDKRRNINEKTYYKNFITFNIVVWSD